MKMMAVLENALNKIGYNFYFVKFHDSKNKNCSTSIFGLIKRNLIPYLR